MLQSNLGSLHSSSRPAPPSFLLIDSQTPTPAGDDGMESGNEVVYSIAAADVVYRTREVGGKLSVKETVAEVICNDLVGKGRE